MELVGVVTMFDTRSAAVLFLSVDVPPTRLLGQLVVQPDDVVVGLHHLDHLFGIDSLEFQAVIQPTQIEDVVVDGVYDR